MTNAPVLIVGAGPTGLVLALSLARRGVPFRLIDRGDGPGEHSRAMVVQARILEFYRQFGFADEMIAQGIQMRRIHLREHVGGGMHEIANVSFAGIGSGMTPYPMVLVFPQDDHERFLIGKLREAGADVEWGAALQTFEQSADGVRATIAHGDGRTETYDAAYICGCDGAHSVVRHTSGIGFEGGTYEQLYYVADVTIASGFERDAYLTLGTQMLSLMFPVRSSGMQRLIGLVPPELSRRTDLTFEDIRAQVDALMGISVTNVNWFSTYRVHHRVAERFRAGRAFLLGDAGHVHSPAGGQGMNTGIGDAINLGWKLAEVVRGRADAALFDTYEPERIAFARALVATTDRVFSAIVRGGAAGELARLVLAPLTMLVGTRFELGRQTIFRILSQTQVHYPNSALSDGQAGSIHGGDRLPWVADHDNFVPLASLDWQVHVYGAADARLARTCASLDLPLHVFPWTEGAGRAGLARDAAYLVRPDGYVAVAAADDAAARIDGFVRRLGLRGVPSSSVART